jgi:hypothetical protein
MRLFRQPSRGDWSSVFMAMAHRLAPLAHSPCKPARTIVTPIAIGELIDKITILEIKAQRITDERKLNNVRHELALLVECQVNEAISHPRLDALKVISSRINAELWDLEDRLRQCEQNEDFGAQFVTLARAVYQRTTAAQRSSWKSTSCLIRRSSKRNRTRNRDGGETIRRSSASPLVSSVIKLTLEITLLRQNGSASLSS